MKMVVGGYLSYKLPGKPLYSQWLYQGSTWLRFSEGYSTSLSAHVDIDLWAHLTRGLPDIMSYKTDLFRSMLRTVETSFQKTSSSFETMYLVNSSYNYSRG